MLPKGARVLTVAIDKSAVGTYTVGQSATAGWVKYDDKCENSGGAATAGTVTIDTCN